MPFIDTHVHLVDPLLPGSKGFPQVVNQGPQAIVKSLLEAYKPGHTLLAMGSLSCSKEDPLGIKTTQIVARELIKHEMKVGLIGIIDPRYGQREDHLERIEALAANREVLAFKAYLGYLHFGPLHERYQGYYKIAEKYDLPVIFHTGDTHSTTALLKYTQPLLIDEVAVKYPTVQFVMAHFGNPWLMEAAGVLFKNTNVWADLSAIASTDQPTERDKIVQHIRVLKSAGARLDTAIAYTEAPERLLYGTDWPLVNPETYEQWITDSMHAVVPDFDQNAKKLFKLDSFSLRQPGELGKPGASSADHQAEVKTAPVTSWPRRP